MALNDPHVADPGLAAIEDRHHRHDPSTEQAQNGVLEGLRQALPAVLTLNMLTLMPRAHCGKVLRALAGFGPPFLPQQAAWRPCWIQRMACSEATGARLEARLSPARVGVTLPPICTAFSS